MRSLLGVGLAASLLAGCAPTSQYRYSAFTPSARPMAWDGRTARAGSVRIEGTMSAEGVNQNLFPKLHDTALWVPGFTVEGAAMLAISRRVEIGVRGSYASYQWANATATGTMPVPDAPASWGAGPEIRMAFPVDDKKHFFIGVGGNIMNYQVPYAQWTLTGPNSTSTPTQCTPSPTCVPGSDVSSVGVDYYKLSASQTESHMVYTLALYPSYAFGERGEWGHAFAGMTLTSGFQNDGFTNQASTTSTVNTFWPLAIASVGYGILLGDMFRVQAQLFKPLTGGGSPVDYNIGGMLTLGIEAPIFEDDSKPD